MGNKLLLKIAHVKESLWVDAQIFEVSLQFDDDCILHILFEFVTVTAKKLLQLFDSVPLLRLLDDLLVCVVFNTWYLTSVRMTHKEILRAQMNT